MPELTNTGQSRRREEDTQHVSGDPGIMALVVRHDAGGTLVDADGDYAPLQTNAAGALRVSAVGAAGGTSMVDDAAFTVEIDTFTPVGGILDDVAPDSVDEGDGGVFRMSANRNQYVQIRDDAGAERGLNIDAAGALTAEANVRDGAGVALTSTLVGADQALDVNIVAGAGAGGTSMVDDAPFTPATTAITPAGAMFDDVAPDSVDEGDGGVVRMSANRNLYTTIRDAAGNERGLNVDAAGLIGITDGGGTLTVDDGGVALSVDDAGGTLTVDDGGLSLTVDNPALSVVGGGAEATALRVTVANDSTGLLSVDDNAGSLTVDNPILSVVGGGAEATAQRVTIANDSTGLLSVDDGGGSLTIDGTVTIQEPLSVDDNGGSLTVDNAALSVVGGGVEATAQRVTIANDSTGILTVDDGGASLTVDNPALSVVNGGVEATALRVTIANDSTGLISVDDNGGSLSVDDNAGSLTVDNPVLSVVGGGAEATAQRVTIANDSTGVLTVDDGGGSLTVDGGVTADIRDGAGNALTSTLVGADQSLDVNITQSVAVTIQEPLSVDDNGASLTVDNAALSVVGGGAEAAALRVTIANDSTGLLSVDDNAGSLTIDNAALSVVGGGAEATALRVTIANDSTGVLTVDNTVLSVVGGGAEATAQRVTIANDSTGLISVDDNGASLTVDAAGDVADDAVDSGNPIKIGGVAVETDGTDPTSVSAEDDRAEVRTDRNRRLLVNTVHPNLWSTNDSWAAAQTDTAVKAAPGANLSLYITDVTMSTEGACNITLVRNTAASVDIYGPFYFAANGGLVKHFATPIRLPANENLGVTSSAAVNHTVSVQGYTAP